jgi:hypothetical protein
MVLAIAVAAGVLAATAISLEIGYRRGRRDVNAGKPPTGGDATIEAAVFALLGLLLGFSFAGGTSRLDYRRQLIVKEVNAIGTAYLRLDLLKSGEQPEMRQLFRDYLDQRLRVYQAIPDMPAVVRELDRAAGLQKAIWQRAVTATLEDPGQNLSRLLLPAINDMIDVTTARTATLTTHTPNLILGLLTVVTLLSGLLAGYGMSQHPRRSWLHMAIYPLAVALTLYTVVDLDYPRMGLILVDGADRALWQLRDSMR